MTTYIDATSLKAALTNQMNLTLTESQARRSSGNGADLNLVKELAVVETLKAVITAIDDAITMTQRVN